MSPSSSSSKKQTERLLQAILLCFFVSGAAGLIYEILWIRMLGLVFGHTVHAITTVLVAFMGGLALGSYLCGRVAVRVENLLKLYGLLEIGIGLYCLMTPWLMEVIKLVYLWSARSFDLPFTLFTLVQFFLASLVLLLPTTLMGATLPILSRLFVKDLGSVGRRVGVLYASNTFGAVLGTYLAGFELLPAIGTRLTLFFAVALNIGIGWWILRLDRKRTPLLALSPQSAAHPPAASLHALRLTPHVSFSDAWDEKTWWILIAFAYSGAASMIYEIAWTRALSLIIGSSTYAFSAMLLSFLVGIAVGSVFFARLTERVSVSLVWFVGLQLAIAFSAGGTFLLFDRLPELFLAAFQISQNYSFIMFTQVAISFVVMLLPTLFIGATFPCAVRVFSKDLSRVGYDVGRVYAANTVGAILGSFATGFILIPLIGVQSSIKAAILMNLLVGLTLFLYVYQKTFLRVVAVTGVVGAAWVVMFLPAWDQQMMSSGVAIYASNYLGNARRGEATSVRDNVTGDKVLFYQDGISATVTVHHNPEAAVTFLRVNGKTDASTSADMDTQLMLGHLPALLHPDPKSALVIGLGSGVTVGALAQYDLDQIEVVEIEPAVVGASSFFKKENRNALSDPRVRLHIADGRNFLLTTPQRYDLIVSEPSNPWIGGVATLFTVEFFSLARQHLNPNGIMAQWFHAYSMTPDDFQMVLASFRSVFPNATLWRMGNADYILLGTTQPLVVDLDRIRLIYKTHAVFREDMARAELLSPEAVLNGFYLDQKDLGRFTMGARLNTDDRLPLEFSAPRSLYEKTIDINQARLQSVKQSRYPALKSARFEDLDHQKVQPVAPQ